MTFFKFKKEDIFRNRMKLHPDVNILIYDQSIHYRDSSKYFELYGFLSGAAHPFVTKEGSLSSFKTISTTAFNSDFAYGDTLTGSYPFTSDITTERFTTGQTRRVVTALKNTLNYYKYKSVHYAFNSSLGNKGTQELRLISIPSILYGSQIKPGSVSLKFYLTGVLAAELVDDKRNGELRQRLPADVNSGSVGGTILYNEGFMILTGTWSIHPTHTEDYNVLTPTVAVPPSWVHFSTTGSATPVDGTNVASSSFGIDFEGTQYVPVVTMLAHAGKGELNFSHNPTFLNFDNSGTVPLTGSGEYKENTSLQIKNTIKTNFSSPTGTFNNVTYISKIGIFDKDRNLIGVAKLSNPVRKREEDDFTFRLKIDF